MLQRAKAPKAPTGRVDVALAIIADTEAQCPRCYYVDKVAEALDYATNRGGLKIYHLSCPCCGSRWRRIDVG